MTYRVEFHGLDDSRLEQRLNELSETVTRRAETPAGMFQLRRRIANDEAAFQRVLRAEGYYAATVAGRIDRREDQNVVVFDVDAGPRFMLGQLRLTVVHNETGSTMTSPLPKELGLQSGGPAIAEGVLEAETKLLDGLRNFGYPFPEVVERKVVVDHAVERMNVDIRVDPGSAARYGQLHIRGLEKVEPRVLQIEQPWSEDGQFDAREIAHYRKRLLDSGLFSVVRVSPVAPVNEDGKVALEVDVTERKHRTVGFGAQYFTDEGFGTYFRWEHRNLWGLGRRLSFETRIGELRQDADVTLSLERFRRRDQRLVLSLSGGRYDPDAFESLSLRMSTILERRFTDAFKGSAGIVLKLSEVEQLGERERFQLFSFPVEAGWDRSDNLLNPTRGFRLAGRVEPFVDFIGQRSAFLKTQATASYYLALDENATWVLAFRGKLGSITGETRDNVPADERFYAGGGGSVRGYPFQSVGPLVDDDPLGGRSLLESSAELRWRITGKFGLVGFLDAGSAFESEYPDFSEDILVGAGAGLRYFSPIGPFRFDLAVPLDKRDGVDDSFQVYLSIGQAF